MCPMDTGAVDGIAVAPSSLVSCRSGPSGTPDTPALSTVRTRSELNRALVNEAGSKVVIKEELLDYSDDDGKFNDYQDEVFIIDDSAVDDSLLDDVDDSSDTGDNGDGQKIPVKKSNKSEPVTSRAYTAVVAARKAASSARILNPTPACTNKTSTGNLQTLGDDRSSRTGISSSLGQRINWTCSFGRPDGLCGTCVGGRHAALMATGGGPVALIATDQCFPACLPAVNGECLRIVRVEGGALREIVLALADSIAGKKLVKGTVILIGSVSHMASVGTAQYTLDWVRSRQWLLDRFGAEIVVVLPVIPVPVSGIVGSSVVRSMLEVFGWFSSLDSTETLLCKKSINQFCTTHLGQTSLGVVMNERLCLRLPVSLDSRGACTFVSEGWGSRPDGVPPLPRAAEQALVLSIVSELNEAFGLELDENPSFERSTDALKDLARARMSELTFLVIGGSHADRLADALCATAPFVERETVGGWKVSKANVSALVEKLTDSALEPDIVVLQCLDNNAFFCQEEDGSLTLPKKGLDNHFHVVGELKVATTEQSRQLAKLLTPLVKVFPNATKILVTPLPRYTVVPCCEEESHLVGRGKEMAARIRADLATMKRALRTAFFSEKAGPVSWLDPADIPGTEDAKTYTDSVHLRESWYASLADRIKSMAAGSPMQGPSASQSADTPGRKRKRAGEDQGHSGSFPAARRGSFRGTGSFRGGRGGPRRGSGSGSGWNRYTRW